MCFNMNEHYVCQLISFFVSYWHFMVDTGKFGQISRTLCIDIVLIFFHILVLQEYCVLTESRIPFKPVLGGVRIVALSISSHEQTQ